MSRPNLLYDKTMTANELAHAKGRIVSKLTKKQVEFIQKNHSDFLNQYKVEVVAL